MGQEYRNTAIYTAFDDFEHPDLSAPERNLLRAVLMNAIADINRSGDHSRKAREYFLSKEDDYLFSFQSVCSYLNINPHHILILVGLEELPDRFKRPDRQGDTQIIADETMLSELSDS
jgi:hypothetical protein